MRRRQPSCPCRPAGFCFAAAFFAAAFFAAGFFARSSCRLRRSLCRSRSGVSGSSGGLLLRDRDDDVRDAALVAERTAHRGRADTLHARAFVRDGGLDVEVVDIDVETLFVGEIRRVLNRRAQHLLDHRRPALVGERDDVDSGLDALALDEVEHELGLLRAAALELCLGAEFGSCWSCCLSHN